MREIPLTQGKVALVDDKDFDWLNQWKWHYAHGYALRRKHTRLDTRIYKGVYIYMHRLIMDYPDGVDHINGYSLDNRRENLRICTQKDNVRNRKIQCNNKSGYKGVYWNKYKNRWEPSITVNGKKVYLGRFITVEEAAKTYDKAAKKYFGEFARTNYA